MSQQGKLERGASLGQRHQPISGSGSDANSESGDGDRADAHAIDDASSSSHVSEKAHPSRWGNITKIFTGASEKEDFDPGPPPDGGFTAWNQAAMGHLVAFNTWGYLNTFGVFQSFYETDLLSNHSSSEISWIGSVQTFLIFAVGTFSGRALDAGFFRTTYYSGILLSLLGLFMSSLATGYYQVFLSQGLAFGLGGGLQFCPVIALVATYFSKRRPIGLTILLAGTGSGGMVFPAVVRELLPKLGYAWTIRILGFIILGTSAVTVAFLKPRLPPRRSGPLVDWEAFKDAPFTIYVLSMWFNFFALYFGFYYITPYARDVVGLSYHDSINLLLVVNGLGIPGRLIPAAISVYFCGPVNTMIPLALISGVMVYAWSGVTSVGGLYVFAALYSLGGNGFQGLWPSPISAFTPDLTKTGTRLGMGFTIVSFALLTGPPVGGALVSRDGGDYLYAQMWAGTMMMVGFVGLIIARIAKTGFVLRAVV